MYVAWVLFIEGRGLKWMYILCGHTVIINYSAQPSPLLLLLQKTVSFALKVGNLIFSIALRRRMACYCFWWENLYTQVYLYLFNSSFFYCCNFSGESIFARLNFKTLAQLIAQPGWVLFQRTTPKAETFRNYAWHG